MKKFFIFIILGLFLFSAHFSYAQITQTNSFYSLILSLQSQITALQDQLNAYIESQTEGNLLSSQSLNSNTNLSSQSDSATCYDYSSFIVVVRKVLSGGVILYNSSVVNTPAPTQILIECGYTSSLTSLQNQALYSGTTGTGTGMGTAVIGSSAGVNTIRGGQGATIGTTEGPSIGFYAPVQSGVSYTNPFNANGGLTVDLSMLNSTIGLWLFWDTPASPSISCSFSGLPAGGNYWNQGQSRGSIYLHAVPTPGGLYGNSNVTTQSIYGTLPLPTSGTVLYSMSCTDSTTGKSSNVNQNITIINTTSTTTQTTSQANPIIGFSYKWLFNDTGQYSFAFQSTLIYESPTPLPPNGYPWQFLVTCQNENNALNFNLGPTDPRAVINSTLRWSSLSSTEQNKIKNDINTSLPQNSSLLQYYPQSLPFIPTWMLQSQLLPDVEQCAYYNQQLPLSS
ncbi:MAG TPA: hypothetical protein VJC12_00640 [Candidatus Paceibacterota bacterium]